MMKSMVDCAYPLLMTVKKMPLSVHRVAHLRNAQGKKRLGLTSNLNIQLSKNIQPSAMNNYTVTGT